MAIHDFRSQRIYVDSALSQGKDIEASREQANYLLNVLRLKEGAEILAFNGCDGEWRMQIHVEGRKKCRLQPIKQVRHQPPPSSLAYCFAPLKQGRLDYMVQKAVEMGAGVLQPIITEFTQVRSPNHKRMTLNAIEAAEQCGILNLPEIRNPVELRRLPETLTQPTRIFFCDEEAAQIQLVSNITSAQPNSLALLVGPEGGFSPAEREMVYKWPNVTLLGLGPRILRADTAAVAALAIVQSNFGDWYISQER